MNRWEVSEPKQSSDRPESVLESRNGEMAQSLAAKVSRLKEMVVDVNREAKEHNQFLDQMVTWLVLNTCLCGVAHGVCGLCMCVCGCVYSFLGTKGISNHNDTNFSERNDEPTDGDDQRRWRWKADLLSDSVRWSFLLWNLLSNSQKVDCTTIPMYNK